MVRLDWVAIPWMRRSKSPTSFSVGSTGRSRSSCVSSAATCRRNSGRLRAVAKPRLISARIVVSCASRWSMVSCTGFAYQFQKTPAPRSEIVANAPSWAYHGILLKLRFIAISAYRGGREAPLARPSRDGCGSAGPSACGCRSLGGGHELRLHREPDQVDAGRLARAGDGFDL